MLTARELETSPSRRLPDATPPGAIPAIVSRPHSASAPLVA